MNRIIIDEEFKNLISRLSEDEYKQLEESILRDGCRDPLVIWAEKGILLDGHHRHAICTKHGRTYQVVTLTFEDKGDAREWVLKNQLGRRNLPPEMIAYLRGKLYEAQKQRSGGDHKSERHDAAFDDGPGDTANRLAQQQGVDRRTIQKAAAFARAVDLIAETAGDEAKQLILSGESGLDRERIKRLALDAPDKVRFEMEVASDLHAADEDDDQLQAEQIDEANRATRAVTKSRTLKTLDAVAKLSRSFAQFSSFILKFRGAESADETVADWNHRQAKWLYEEVDSITREMRSWQIALERRFPDLREQRARLKAVN